MVLDRLLLAYGWNGGNRLEIIFRQLLEPVRSQWKPGVHWQVEAYEESTEHPPVAIAWVQDVVPGRVDEVYPPDLECVRVFRDFAGPHYAHAVIDAARVRWPNMTVSKGCTAEGTEWMASYRAGGGGGWVVVGEDR